MITQGLNRQCDAKSNPQTSLQSRPTPSAKSKGWNNNGKHCMSTLKERANSRVIPLPEMLTCSQDSQSYGLNFSAAVGKREIAGGGSAKSWPKIHRLPNFWVGLDAFCCARNSWLHKHLNSGLGTKCGPGKKFSHPHPPKNMPLLHSSVEPSPPYSWEAHTHNFSQGK